MNGLTLNSHESVAAFAAWLTCQKEPLVFGSSHDCVPVVDAVKAFAESQNLPPVRDDFGDRIAPYPDTP